MRGFLARGKQVAGDAFLVLRIASLVAALPLLLRLKLPTLLALLDRRRPPPPLDPSEGERKAAKLACYVDAVLRLGRPVLRRNCLTRSLTLFYFLRRSGLEVSLSFGVGKPGAEPEGNVEGHCWLVRGGEPFLEARDPRPVFAEYYRFPDAERSLDRSKGLRA